MTQGQPAGESLPEVFDRIVASMGGVQKLVDNPGPQPEQPTGIVVEHSAGPVTVVIEDGRMRSIAVDPDASQARLLDLLPEIRDAVNEALSRYERAHLAELEKINAEFGSVLRHLGGLQADVHAAYRNDVARLRP